MREQKSINEKLQVRAHYDNFLVSVVCPLWTQQVLDRRKVVARKKRDGEGECRVAIFDTSHVSHRETAPIRFMRRAIIVHKLHTKGNTSSNTEALRAGLHCAGGVWQGSERGRTSLRWCTRTSCQRHPTLTTGTHPTLESCGKNES